MDGVEFGLWAEAIKLEGLYFQDMTLESFPQIFNVLDEWGVRANPSIERASFHVLESDGTTLGRYDVTTKSISLVLDGPNLISSMCHEMIHHYESELNELDESLAQYLTVKLWQKLRPAVPDLEERVLAHIEATGHRELQNEGGRHDVLFLLKSYDIDMQLDEPLGTTFGYGYDSPDS